MLKQFLILSLLCQFLFISTGLAQSPSPASYSSGKSSFHNYHRKNRLSRSNREVARVQNPRAAEKPSDIGAQVLRVAPAATPTPVQISQGQKNPEKIEIDGRENFGDDLKGGNVVVKVTSNGSATARLGMAQRGVVVIEFPASDPVYKIYAGDENYVRVDCGVRDKDDRCQNLPGDTIILYPGKLFNQWETSEDAETAVTVQRASGIVVSFIVVPVRTMANHAFHVAVRYDLDEVIAQRRAAGLPFNLVQSIGTQPVPTPTAAPAPKTFPSGSNETAASENSGVKFQNAVLATDGQPGDKPASDDTDNPDLETKTTDELKRAAKSAGRLYFGKPLHGLSLAVASSDTRISDYAIDVVAVKNVSAKPIRLVPDQPELFIDSLGNAKTNAAVSSERLSILYVATTAEADDVLQPNQVYYFAFTYKTPILGAKQSLRAGFAQREAADEPSTLALLGLVR